jgi:hypothetical protein
MKYNVIYLSILISTFLFISCKKNQDNLPPTIEVYTPNEEDTLESTNSEYEIKYKAHDENTLSKSILSIKDIYGTEFASEDRDINGSDYTYKNTFTFSGTKGQIKKLSLMITIFDKSKNTTSKNVHFFVKL